MLLMEQQRPKKKPWITNRSSVIFPLKLVFIIIGVALFFLIWIIKKHFFSPSSSSSSSLSSKKVTVPRFLFSTIKRGLINLGNTCYFNSALQCLFKTFELYKACQTSMKGQDGKFSKTYVTFCKEMLTQETQPFKPKELLKLVANYNPLFADYKQHDSGEVLGTMLVMLHLEMNEVAKREVYKISEHLRRDEGLSEQLLAESVKKDHRREKSIVDDVIYGRYKIVYQCLRCGEKYILFEKFHAVLLPVSSKKNLRLSDCFEEFAEPTFLTNENKWFCDRCQSEQDTRKTMTVYQTNKILFVFLKRYTETEKISCKIDVPLRIGSAYMRSAKEGEYALYGMIIQSGSLNSGHYIAVCWDETNGWAIFDDSRTSPISEDRAREMARDAYILAYRRVEAEE